MRQDGDQRILYSGPQNLNAVFEIDCAAVK
jgi:hypothetical protein